MEESPTPAERVGIEKIKRKEGYRHYVGTDGNVWAVNPKTDLREQVSSEKVVLDDRYSYFLGKDGYVWKRRPDPNEVKETEDAPYSWGGIIAGIFITYVIFAMIELLLSGPIVLIAIALWIIVISIALKYSIKENRKFETGYCIGSLGLIIGLIERWVLNGGRDEKGSPANSSLIIAITIGLALTFLLGLLFALMGL